MKYQLFISRLEETASSVIFETYSIMEILTYSWLSGFSIVEDRGAKPWMFYLTKDMASRIM